MIEDSERHVWVVVRVRDATERADAAVLQGNPILTDSQVGVRVQVQLDGVRHPTIIVELIRHFSLSATAPA